MKKIKYFPFFLGTFFLAWILGALRFSSEVADTAFQILLFPSHIPLVAIEQYGMTHPGSLQNNEFFQGVVFLGMVVMQSLLFFFIWKQWNKVKGRSHAL